MVLTPISSRIHTSGYTCVIFSFYLANTPAAFLQSDLDLFFGNFSPSLVGQSPTFVSIDGGQHLALCFGVSSYN